MRGTEGIRFNWYGVLGAVCLALLMLSCSGGGGSSEDGAPAGSGEILLTLQLDDSDAAAFGLQEVEAEFDCIGNHIDTIEVLVFDAAGNLIAEGGPFRCVDGSGTVSGVPAGRNYRVEVNALDLEGFTIFSGEETEVTVLANRVNAVGPVILRQVMNRKPRIQPPIGDRSVLEGEALTFTVTAEDPDAAQSLAFSAGDLPRGATFRSQTQVFSWTPGFADAGVYAVLFRVVDDGVPPLSDAETVNITVGDANAPPRLDPPGNYTVNEGETVSFTVTASDPDPGDTLTLSAGDLPPGAVFGSATGAFSWETGFEDAGSYTVRFTVTDDGRPPKSDAQSSTITVGDVNRPPILDPVGNRDAVQGELLEIVITARDPDGDALTFSAGDLPSGSAFDPGSQTFSWQPDPSDIGSHTVLFSVVDDGVPPLSDFEEIVITVGTGNRPPALDPIGNRTVEEGEFLEFVVTARDPDNDPLEFSAENLPGGAAFDADIQRFSWQTGFEDAGNYTVTFTVSDVRPDSLSDAETITITVGDVNRPPVLDPIGTRNIDRSVQDSVSFTVTANDPDGDPLTYEMVRAPEGATFVGQEFEWSPGVNDTGAVIVTFRASDNQDPPLSDVESGQINVSYTPPRVVSTQPSEGDTVTNPETTITVNFSNNMSGGSINGNTFEVFGPNEGRVSGSLSVIGRSAVFTPSSPLTLDGTYFVDISDAVTDINGVPLQSAFFFDFALVLPGESSVSAPVQLDGQNSIGG